MPQEHLQEDFHNQCFKNTLLKTSNTTQKWSLQYNGEELQQSWSNSEYLTQPELLESKTQHRTLFLVWKLLTKIATQILCFCVFLSEGKWKWNNVRTEKLLIWKLCSLFLFKIQRSKLFIGFKKKLSITGLRSFLLKQLCSI